MQSRYWMLGVGALLLAATAWAATGVENAVLGNYLEEGDLLRAGNIIQSTAMSRPGQTASDCRDLCDGNPDCAAYSFVQQAPDRKPLCYERLIANPRDTVRNNGFEHVTSGTKLSFFTDVLHVRLHGNRSIQGADPLRSFPTEARDPVACARACRYDDDCNSFTYAPPQPGKGQKDAMCYLNKGVGLLKTAPDMLAGQKIGATKGRATPKSSPRPKVQGATAGKPILAPERKLEPVAKPKLTVPSRVKPGDVRFPGEMLDPASKADEDTKFPGEMLDGGGSESDEQSFPGEMLTPEQD